MSQKPEQYIAVTADELAELKNAAARDHVLQTLKELQQWRDKGKNIQNYILLKECLYTCSFN